MCDNSSLKQSMNEIFEAAQKTAATHQRGILALKRLYNSHDHSVFLQQILPFVEKILMENTKVKNPFVERLVEFIAKFCATLKSSCTKDDSDDESFDEHPLLMEFFLFLLKTQESHLDEVRFRSCQIINKILNEIVDSAMSDTLWDKLEDCLLERLEDPKAVIRQQAIIPLFRLQDPTDSENNVMKKIIFHMESDPNAKVRLVCVDKIALNKNVFEILLRKIRDVDENVRLAAYKRFSKYPRQLKIAQKRLLTKCAIMDESNKVKNYMQEFFSLWLNEYSSVLEFMKAFRLDADEKDIEETITFYEYVLQFIFQLKPIKELTEVLPLNDQKLISFNELSYESVAFWRIYIQFLRTKDTMENELDLVIPEVVFVCKYIDELQHLFFSNDDISITQILEVEFIFTQLFEITKTFDYSDVASRQCLNNLAKKMLEHVAMSFNVIKAIVENLELTIPDVDSRTKFICEIISEIMYPLDSEESHEKSTQLSFQISQLKVQLNTCQGDLEEAIKSENFLEAGSLKLKIESIKASLKDLEDQTKTQEQVEKKTDIPTIVKYLEVAIAMLQSPNITKLTSALQTLSTNVIQELIIHPHDAVKTKAFQSYALCCIVDKISAQHGIHMFSLLISAYKAGQECDTDLLKVCIKATVDLLLIYGLKLIAEPEPCLSESTSEEQQKVFNGGTSLTDIIQGLVDLMDDEQEQLQEVAAEGLCKLVLSGRVVSASVLSRLVLMWFNPACPDSSKMKQIIGLTLQAIPHLSDTSDDLQDTIVITIKTLLNAPKSSPLADINIDDVLKFLVSLTQTSPEAKNIHENLILKMCCDMKEKPRARTNAVYSRLLPNLLLPEKQLSVQKIINLCEDIREDVIEINTIRNLTKYIAILKVAEEKFTVNTSPIKDIIQEESHSE